MKVMEFEVLFPIYEAVLEGVAMPVVIAKEFYKGMDLGISEWSRWSKKNIEQNEYNWKNKDWDFYIESDKLILHKVFGKNPKNSYEKDFIDNSEKTNNKKYSQNYILTLDFAERLAMTLKSEKGELARRYFQSCRDRLKNIEKNEISGLHKKIDELLNIISKQDTDKNLNNNTSYKVVSKPVSKTLYKISDIEEAFKLKKHSLYSKLRDLDILSHKVISDRIVNIPLLKYIDSGYFIKRPVSIKDDDGDSIDIFITLVTDLGLHFLFDILLKDNFISSQDICVMKTGTIKTLFIEFFERNNDRMFPVDDLSHEFCRLLDDMC